MKWLRMHKLTYLFTNAGIWFFLIEIGSSKCSTLALMRDPKSHKLMSVIFNGEAESNHLNEYGLRDLDAIAEYHKVKVTEFRYESHNFVPDFSAKRQLSALKLGVILPSIAMIPIYLDNFREWAKIREKRSLCTRDLETTIEALEELSTKTPKELCCEDSYMRLTSAAATLSAWIGNRKRYRLRTREMHGALKCINKHIEALYASV